MTDRNICSGQSSKVEQRQVDDGNGVKEAKGKSQRLDEFNLLDSETTMFTSAGIDIAKENKRIAWETMLPSKKATTIGFFINYEMF